MFTIWSCLLNSLGPWMELQVSSPPKLVTLINSYLLFCRSECIFHIFLDSFFLNWFLFGIFLAYWHHSLRSSQVSFTNCFVPFLNNGTYFLSPARLCSPLGSISSEDFTFSLIWLGWLIGAPLSTRHRFALLVGANWGEVRLTSFSSHLSICFPLSSLCS